MTSASLRVWSALCWGVFVLVFISIASSGGLGSALFGGLGALVSAVVLWRSTTARLSWDDEGLTIRNSLRTRRLPWSEVRGARSIGVGAQVVTVFKAAAIDTSRNARAITVDATACLAWRKPPKDSAAAAVQIIESELRRRRG